MKQVMLVLALFVVPVVRGQVVEEKVLIPIAISSAAGEHGSLWSSGTSGYNTADHNVSARFASGGCQFECGNGTVFVPGESTEVVLKPAPIERPGRVMFFTKGEASLVKMGSFLVQEGSVNPGVWIPPIYEGDLFTGAAHLIELPPTDRGARLRLRIYSPDYTSAGIFRIRIYSMVTQGLLFDGTVTMTPGESEFSPAYTEFSDFPETGDPIRVQIDPQVESTSYWPFISVTSNATDAATIVLPSHP